MLITVTQDDDIRDWVEDAHSGADQWFPVQQLSKGGQPGAGVQLAAALKSIGRAEPLLVTGHGNDDEIGDKDPTGPESWVWGAKDFAELLASNLPDGYTGPIVLEVCADSVANFAAAVAVELEELGKLAGIWLYSYNKSVAATHPFPNPGTLNSNAELQPVQVNAGGDASPVPEASAPKAVKTWPAMQLTSPPAGAGKYNQPAEKFYVFNETGNIMLATTQDSIQKVSPDETNLFREVSVFFAAMTKAISSTVKPGATKPYTPSDYYTIYDYAALEAVVNRSGLFVNVRREDLLFERTQVAVTFDIEFIEAVLGVVLTDGVGATALLATLNAMGKQATFSYNHTGKHEKVGNLLFVCEDLFGMPMVSVLYYYLDEDVVETVVHASPCVSVTKAGFHMKVHRDTFLFVVPKWIEQYAGGLAAVASEADYQQLVAELESYISDTPVIMSVNGGDGPVLDLTDGASYTLEGVNLGTAKGTLTIAGTEQTVATWTNATVSFTAKKPAQPPGPVAGGPIVLVPSGTSGLEAVSADSYAFSS